MVCAKFTIGPDICCCSRAASQNEVKIAAATAAAVMNEGTAPIRIDGTQRRGDVHVAGEAAVSRRSRRHVEMEGRARIGRLPLGRIAGGILRGGRLQLRIRGAALPAAIRRELAAVRQEYLHDAHQRLVAQLVQRLERRGLISRLQRLDDAQARHACDARRAALQILAHVKQARRNVHDHRNGKNDHRGHGDDHSQLLLDGEIGKPTKQKFLLRWRALGGCRPRIPPAPPRMRRPADCRPIEDVGFCSEIYWLEG